MAQVLKLRKEGNLLKKTYFSCSTLNCFEIIKNDFMNQSIYFEDLATLLKEEIIQLKKYVDNHSVMMKKQLNLIDIYEKEFKESIVKIDKVTNICKFML